MSDAPPNPPHVGYVQVTPGAPPVPAGSYGQAAVAYGPPPAAPFGTVPASPPATLGIVALILAIVAVAGASILSAATGFAAAAGAMRHAVAVSPSGLEDLSSRQLLALLSPVRDLVLWAEVGYWAGTVVGVAAIALGIAAVATRRGRPQGVVAIVVAVAGAFVFALILGFAVVTGIGAGTT